MELRTLRYFLTVVQEGNITNAAKRLHVTQPTLSRQLAELEKELGRQLYTRGHAGIIPTEHGVMLANYAESILDLAEKAEADISLPAKTVSGSVHIAAGETKAMQLLTEAMIAVRKEYPEIDLAASFFAGDSPADREAPCGAGDRSQNNRALLANP